MKMLGVLSRKGGVGKTTLATHMAVLAGQAGLRTLLVDLDPQRSAAAWWRTRASETPHLVETVPGDLRNILDAAAEDGVELVVVDTRPSLETDVAHVAALADFVLVPTRPAIFDLRAVTDTLDIVKGVTRRSMVVLNGCPPPRGAGEASVVIDARHALAAFGVTVAPVSVVHRSAFPGAAVDGLTACETDPDSKASKEMRALWRVVEKELNSNGKEKSAKRAGPESRTRAGAGHSR